MIRAGQLAVDLKRNGVRFHLVHVRPRKLRQKLTSCCTVILTYRGMR